MSLLDPHIRVMRALAKGIDDHCGEPAFHDFASALYAAADQLESEQAELEAPLKEPSTVIYDPKGKKP